MRIQRVTLSHKWIFGNFLKDKFVRIQRVT